MGCSMNYGEVMDRRDQTLSWGFLVISWGHLGDIWKISWGYLGDIWGISWGKQKERKKLDETKYE